jgi:hypothetical protein
MGEAVGWRRSQAGASGERSSAAAIGGHRAAFGCSANWSHNETFQPLAGPPYFQRKAAF